MEARTREAWTRLRASVGSGEGGPTASLCTFGLGFGFGFGFGLGLGLSLGLGLGVGLGLGLGLCTFGPPCEASASMRRMREASTWSGLGWALVLGVGG